MKINKKWRVFISDSLAMVSFSFILMVPIEVLYMKLTIEQSLAMRASLILPNICIGLLIGIFSVKYAHLRELNILWKFFFDTVILLVISTIVYCILLYLIGSTRKQIIDGLVSSVIISLLIGRPYGWWQDLFRKKIFKICE